MHGSDSDDTLSITDQDGVIVLVGEIDASTVGSMVDALEAVDGDLVIELSAVRFIDSSGLRALIRAQQAREQEDATLTLRSPSPGVRRLFELSGVADYFTIV